MTVLLRNGDLELGNISFWEAVDKCSIAATAYVKKYGVYSLKVVETATNAKFRHKDYIDLRKKKDLLLTFWHKTSTLSYIKPIFEYYDSNYNLLYTKNFIAIDGTGDWIYNEFFIPKYPEANYVRIAFEYVDVAATTHYLDQTNIYEIERDKIPVLKYTIMNGTYSSSNDTQPTYYPTRSIRKFCAMVKVENVGGTSPTLNIYHRVSNDAGVAFDTDLFGTITTPGIYTRAIEGFLGNYSYFYWTIGGTSPSFDIYLEAEYWL